MYKAVRLSTFFKYFMGMILLGCCTISLPARADDSEQDLKGQFNGSFNDIADKLVIIACGSDYGDWSGSGFIANMDGKTYLFTNQHVVLGADTISFKTAKGEKIYPKAVELSATRDMARLLLDDQDALAISDNVAMDAPMAVFGNSEGGGVATALYGKVNGVGADVVEVSAEFVSGNSGSPVLNTNMEVIGIASYVRYSSPSKMKEGTQFENKVRRFCYRLNDVQWARVDWKDYNKKYGETYRQSEKLVDDIFELVGGWVEDPYGQVSEDHKDYELRRWATEHNHMVGTIVRLSDKGRATRKELDSTNKRIRNGIIDSAEALSELCERHAGHMRLKADARNLTGFLHDEFEGYTYRFEYAAQALKDFGNDLAGSNYFHFK